MRAEWMTGTGGPAWPVKCGRTGGDIPPRRWREVFRGMKRLLLSCAFVPEMLKQLVAAVVWQR